jgi:sporulation protein YlmC with PRC-barrel domain
MVRLSDIEGAAFTNAAGATLGTVEHLLFHPCEPRAVALQVRPSPLGGLVPVGPAFVSIASITPGRGEVAFDGAKLPSRSRAAREIGHDPETTVIWLGMAVASEAGPRFGAVADVELADDWAVESLLVSTGAVGDLAHGRLRARGDVVVGFDGRAVVVRAVQEDLEASGGAAKAAAAAAGAVKERAGVVADAAGSAVVDAGYIAGRAVRAVRSAAGSKAAGKARGALRGVADAFRDGYRGDDGKDG